MLLLLLSWCRCFCYVVIRGEVRVVGCTSLDKYRKFIEKDPGLERRFQTVAVEASSVAESISILRGLRHK
jgi:ATP-dependent Clp protease ATP-binding subunit ClpC